MTRFIQLSVCLCVYVRLNWVAWKRDISDQQWRELSLKPMQKYTTFYYGSLGNKALDSYLQIYQRKMSWICSEQPHYQDWSIYCYWSERHRQKNRSNLLCSNKTFFLTAHDVLFYISHAKDTFKISKNILTRFYFHIFHKILK